MRRVTEFPDEPFERGSTFLIGPRGDGPAHFDGFQLSQISGLIGAGRVASVTAAGPVAAVGPAGPTALNEAPLVTGLGGDSVAFVEGGAGVRLDLGGNASVADPGGTGFQMSRVGIATQPVFVAPLPDGSGRVLVLEKAGVIKILDPVTGTFSATPYLDVRDQVSILDEDGLVGFTTAPDFATSGISYVFLVNSAGDIEVRQYQTSPESPEALDPADYQLILTLPTPTTFHNGGWMDFGPDGCLYIAVGDANIAPDFPLSQDPYSLHGKILRIDVSGDDFPDDPLRNYAIPDDNPFVAGGGGAPEVWATGLRNPYRGSFDPVTGHLLVGDVGQGAIEEIDLIVPGANYGWPFEEGSQPYFGTVPTDGFTLPVIEYPHGGGPFAGNSVIGGYVYRGPIEALQGQYIFGDFIRGNVWAVPVSSLTPGTTITAEGFTSLNGAFAPDAGKINLITSFGVDEDGNLFVCDFDGEIFRLAPTTGGNFAGGSLKVAITENLVAAEDRLQIDTSADTGVTLSNGLAAGGEVRIDGVLIGRVAFQGNGTNGNALIVDFSGGATPEQVSRLIHAVTYANNNQVNPVEGERTITFTLVDGGGTAGGGSDRVMATSKVTVTGVNDAPDGTDGTMVAVQDTPYVFQVGHFGLADGDGDALAAVVITTLPDDGALLFDADGAGGNDPVAVTAGQEISAPDIAAGRLVFNPVAGELGDPYTDFTFQLRDDGGTAGGGADFDLTPNRLTIVVVAPGARPDAFTTNEATTFGAARNLFADNGFGMDVVGGGATLTVTAVNGQAADVGRQITLASGALLTVNADGTFSYDPNSVFDTLTAAGSGAVNLSATDSFTYAINGGLTTTVELLVQGLVSAEDELLGGPGADSITGTTGSDRIDGREGADTLTGLGGDDLYRVDDSGDLVHEAVGGGNDTILASVSYALAGGSEIEILSAADEAGTGPINLAGNGYANRISGNAGANLLDGGAGADILTGFAGNDSYFVDEAGDAVNETAGQGFDTVYALADYVLAGGVSVEVLSAVSWVVTSAINLTGNDLANFLYGTAGANILDGGAGSDLMTGFGGNDVYFVDHADDAVVEAAGQGFDTIYASRDYVLGAGVHAEVLSAVSWTSIVEINLTGNELANRLYGNAGANLLTGGAGDDWLHGRGGGDTLVGGLGDDVYWMYALDDEIVETAGNGYDTAYLYTSYVLGADANVEVVSTYSWIDASTIDLTGNGLANRVFGNAGSNRLDGGAGNDLLTGFGGEDIFAFTTALGAGNVDTITDFLSGTDSIALDDAIFTALGEPGALAAGAFVTGGTAIEADDRILYDGATGRLLYDADGSGAGAAIHFATLGTDLVLAASDFQVI